MFIYRHNTRIRVTGVHFGHRLNDSKLILKNSSKCYDLPALHVQASVAKCLIRWLFVPLLLRRLLRCLPR